MNIALLSLEQSPPLAVPLRYLLTAPLFAAVAGLLLATGGTEILADRWTPQTLALTHLIVLGFLTMVMVGAIQQILPVLLGARVPQESLFSTLVHLLLTLGVTAFAVGFGWEWRGGLGIGLLLLTTALLLFVAVAIRTLLASSVGHATRLGITLAVTSLLIAAGFGLYLLAGHAWHALPLARGLTDLHAIWGLAGWIGLLVMAVAYQVVPMFQVTPDYPPQMTRLLAPGIFGALLLLTAGRLLPPFAPLMAAGYVVMAGLALFAVATLSIQKKRRRRLPDVTLAYWRLAMGSLLLALALLPLQGALGLPEPLPGVLFIIGFAMSAASGMLYKIVPFLVWLHLNNKAHLAGRAARIPNMKQVIPEDAARRQFWSHGVTVAMVAAACLWPALTTPAGLSLCASALLLGWNLLKALRLYRSFPS